MDKIIAYCGIVCTDCAAYQATQAGDREALEKVAVQWRKEYNAPDLTVEDVICDGCQGASGRHCGHWSECDIRICGADRGVATCAHCDDYACEKLERFFGFAPYLRDALDEIRKSRSIDLTS